MWNDYKAFLFRGNLVDLAVAFILGVAFAAVMSAFTEGVVMALVAAVVGQPSFDHVVITVGDSAVLIGTFFTAVLNFLLIASVLFLVVRDEVILLREIRDALRAR